MPSASGPQGAANPLSLLPALAIGLAGFVAIPLAARPLDPQIAAGVFPPWWGAERVTLAGAQAGLILGQGTYPFIIIVRDPAGDAANRLRRAGALLTLDPQQAGGCAPRETTNV